MTNQEIKETIEELLNKLGVEIESITEESIDEASGSQIFEIKSPEGDQLIGRDGQGFKALNYLISRMVEKKDPEAPRFTVDINGYYQKSIESIKQKARFAADRARSYKVDIEMDPMNSFERLIIHSMFSEGGDIKTHSTGEGRSRRVVITYTGD